MNTSPPWQGHGDVNRVHHAGTSAIPLGMSSLIDLRSDTVTRPTPAMREVMAAAEVGDDVYGEDPSLLALEARVAELLGKEAALFMPSGTMANQTALMVHCRPGEEVIIGEGNHLFYYETGAGAAWAGVQFLEAGEGGLFTADEMLGQIKPDIYYMAPTRLVALENTHNRGGGRVFPQKDVEAIAEAARSRGLAVHLDGARLWNASVASGLSEAALAAPFDTVCVCFSKGLGAPVGSAIAGTRAHIERARRLRRMLGGAMRQAGVLGQAALYALEHHRERLVDDHQNAKRFAEGVAALDGVRCDVATVETNIVNFHLDVSANAFVQRAKSIGLLFNSIGPRSVRAVTHLDLDVAAIDRAVALVKQAREESLSA